MWRELLAATTAMQGPFALAVCEPDPGAGYTQLAREHFGALTPLRAHRSPAQAMGECVSGSRRGGRAAAAVESDDRGAGGPPCCIRTSGVRRGALPFWAPRPEGSASVQALVVARSPPDASEQDRSLLGLELNDDVSRARLTAALTAAGFAPGKVLLRRDPGAPVAHALVEVEGFVAADDPRLDALDAARRPVVLGAYAVPGYRRQPHDHAAPRPEVLTSRPMSAANSTLPGINRILKLSSNEGAFGVPPGAQEAIQARCRGAASLSRRRRRPNCAARSARASGLDPARIVCGAGSDDLIYQLCLAYGGPGRDIVMTAHGFCDLRHRRHLCRQPRDQGAGARADRRRGCDAGGGVAGDADRVPGQSQQSRPARCCRPTRSRGCAPACRPRCCWCSTPPMPNTWTRPDYDPGIKLVDAGDNTVMTRTFSKIFGLGGMRIGWAYAPPAVMDVLNRVRGPFNVTIASQAAAIAALAEPGWVEKGRAHNARIAAEAGRRADRGRASRSGRSEGNFVLADFGATGARPRRRTRSCATRGVIVRAGRRLWPAALPAHHGRHRGGGARW